MEIIKKINGKDYGFKFTTLTMRKYCENIGIEFYQFDESLKSNPPKAYAELLRAAIDVYSKGDIKLSEYEIDDLIENISNEDFLEIIDCYVASVKKYVDRVTFSNDNDVKKK